MTFFRPAAAALVVALATAPTSAQSLFDLDFRGGTIGDYVSAIREVARPVNIVVTAPVLPIRIEPVEFRNVSVDAALKLIEGRYSLPDGSQVEVDLRTASSGNPVVRDAGELTIYKLDGQRKHAPLDPEQQSRVWSLASILGAGQDPQNVLTAIEAALELQDDAPAPAKVRFHRETRLLLARGDVRQLAIIDSLLGELSRERSNENCKAQLEEEKAARTAEKREMEDVLRQCRQETEAMRRAATAAEERAAMLEHRVDQLEDERRALTDEVRHGALQRDELQRRLDASESGGKGR